MNMKADKTPACAPYNFVPFSHHIQTVEKSALPSHNVIDPGLKSGEIHITMTAETPVFVSDGNGKFFRAPDGSCAIPGSTVRGMTRANMKILGFGIMRRDEDLTDNSVYYRRVGGENNDALTKQYKTALGVGKGTTISTPENVCAGYLHRENDRYYIQPVEGQSYYPVSRADLSDWGFDTKRATSVQAAAYRITDGRLERAWPEKSAPKDAARGGFLIVTGTPVGKPNKLCIFPGEDKAAEPIMLDSDCIRSYRIDLEMRKNSLKADTKGTKYDPSFWDLPDEGKCKPVFYCQDECEGQKRIYFGMSRFLRVEHKYSIGAGLPQEHREAAGKLDYVDAIFGYTREMDAYRSRVSFGDLVLTGKQTEGAEINKTLVGPKPSWCRGYIADGKTYSDDEGFELRGYKQYWLKEADTSSVKNSNTTSVLRPFPVGSEFKGVIRYKNLREEELGLLLWSIQLEKDCFQTVGMGKPYGFGRMAVNLELKEYEQSELYGDLAFEPKMADAHGYIRTYRATLGEKHENELQDFFYLKTVHSDFDADTLNYMELGTYKKTGLLPNIDEMQKEEKAAKERRKAEKKQKENAAKKAEEEKKQKEAINAGGIDDWKAMLAGKFNSK